MSDKELTQLCKEFSAQIILAHSQPLQNQMQTANKRANVELAKLTRIKITNKFDKILQNVCSQLSTDSATLYRLCHRKTEMSLTSISTSGTFTDDVALCVLSTLMQEQPTLWSALCYRATLMKPRRPILRLGTTLLIAVTIREVEQFTNRAKHVLNLALPRTCKRQREHEHEQREPECEREHGKPHEQTHLEGEQPSTSSKLSVTTEKNNEQLLLSSSSHATKSTKTMMPMMTKTLLDDEQVEFVATHYFARISSAQEQSRTPALITMRTRDKLQHSSLAETINGDNSRTSKLNTCVCNIGEETGKKENKNSESAFTHINNEKDRKVNDNFYLEPDEEELMESESNYHDRNALGIDRNLSSEIVPSLLTASLWGRGTSNWLQLIAEIKRHKQVNDFEKLSHFISNPLLFDLHKWRNSTSNTNIIQAEHNQESELVNSDIDKTAFLPDQSSLLSLSLLLSSTEAMKKFASMTCYITSKFAWTRLLICALWQLMLESLQIDECNLTYPFWQHIQTLSAHFIQQARRWSVETHCPVCDELQLERAPIHWSLLQEDRKELCRQLAPFMSESESSQTVVCMPHKIASSHNKSHQQVEEVESSEEMEKLKEQKLLPVKENINEETIIEEFICKAFKENDNVNNVNSNSVSLSSPHVQLLWCNLCECNSYNEFCNTLRKSCSAQKCTFLEEQMQYQQTTCCTSMHKQEEQSFPVTEANAFAVSSKKGRSEKGVVDEFSEELTNNMRKLFVILLTHRLHALVQLLENVTQMHYRVQTSSFMLHESVHALNEHHSASNYNDHDKSKCPNVHLNEHCKCLLSKYGWVLGDRAEYTFHRWVNSSFPSLYMLVAQCWLSNVDIEWCTNLLTNLCEKNTTCKCSDNIRHKKLSDNKTECSNSNEKSCKEQLHFIPMVPFLRSKDKVVECARCFAWFHHRCIAPPQDCFIDDLFFCHGCRLLLYKELQRQTNRQHQKSNKLQEKLVNNVIQCSAYCGDVP